MRACGIEPRSEDRDLVFPTTISAPHEGDSVSHQLTKRVRRANEIAKRERRDELPRITFHGLCHSAATLLLARGLSLGEVQKVLGHSQVALTADLYTQFAPEMAQRAAGAMEGILGTGTG